MKIRTDYVTNSSSSSFILGFNNKEEIQEKITAGMPYYWSEHTIQSVISEVENGITTTEEVMGLIEQSIEYGNSCFHGKPLWRMSWDERRSEDVQEFIQEEVNEACKELSEYNIISVVEYEDHTDLGSELEHNIMPYLDCTIRRISHH